MLKANSKFSENSNVGSVLIALIAASLLAFYSFLSSKYPYYFVFDLDYVSTLDSCVLQGGEIPAHLNHTGFGMYLLFLILAKIGAFVGYSTPCSIPELKASLNPLGVIAENVLNVRALSPWMVLVCVLAVWGVLRTWFKSSGVWVSAALLLFVGVQASFTYQAAISRTELYSFLFWALALWIASFAFASERGGSPSKVRNIGAPLICGVLLGLSFLTKIQSFFYLLSFPAFLYLFWSSHAPPEGKRTLAKSLLRRYHGLSVVNLAVFLLLFWRVFDLHIYAAHETYFKAWGVTSVSILFCALMVGQVYVFSPLWRRPVSEFAALGSLLVTGFLASFALHFIAIAGELGWTYLLYDFKILFMRKMYYSVGLKDSFKGFIRFVGFSPVLYLTHVVLCSTYFVPMFRKSGFSIFKDKRFCALFVLVSLAYANAVFGSRFVLRDLLWMEWLLFLSGFLLVLELSSKWNPERVSRFWFVAIAAFLVLFGRGLFHTTQIRHRLDVNYNRYGWERALYARRQYWIPAQLAYDDLMKNRIPKLDRPLLALLSDRVVLAQNDVDFVFQNLKLNGLRVGRVWEGMPVEYGQAEARISELDEALRGAIVVDARGIESEERYFFEYDKTRQHTEHLNKLARKRPPEGALSLLPRPDLKVYLMLPEDAQSVAHLPKDFKKTDLKMVTQKGDRPQVYQAFQLMQYAHFDVIQSLAKESYFFVIQEGQ
ncbi:hypothetical protein WDW86_00825 [Bdellovibrionota bacterium FG-2]